MYVSRASARKPIHIFVRPSGTFSSIRLQVSHVRALRCIATCFLSIDAPLVHRTWKVGRRWPTYIIQIAALYTAIESTSLFCRNFDVVNFRRWLCLSSETLIGSLESSEQTLLAKSALNESTTTFGFEQKEKAFSHNSKFNLAAIKETWSKWKSA